MYQQLFVNFERIYPYFFRFNFFVCNQEFVYSNYFRAASSSFIEKQFNKEDLEIQQNSTHSLNVRPTSLKSNTQVETRKHKVTKEQDESKAEQVSSAEVFQDVLHKINSLGDRGKEMLHRLMKEIDARNNTEGAALKRLVSETMNDKTLSSEAKRRRKRDIVLSSPLHRELTEDGDDGDAPLEEVLLLFHRLCTLFIISIANYFL